MNSTTTDYGYGIIVTATGHNGKRTVQYALDSVKELTEVLAAWMLVFDYSLQQLATMHERVTTGRPVDTLNLTWTWEPVTNENTVTKWQALKTDGMDKRAHTLNLSRAEEIREERKRNNVPYGFIGMTDMYLKPGARMYTCKDGKTGPYLQESRPTTKTTKAWQVEAKAVNLRTGKVHTTLNYFRNRDHAMKWMLAISSSYYFDSYTRDHILTDVA